ncbi:hypothetical protein CH379_013395 [Leptospira ellisii]|uniref:DUF403 domain-containing protein n=1 Tax=Leptospira ellisii TaxID=2023197 RepID=A0A2N0BNK4_9LEPT|nr:hypothetical protein [Leptospira ellisii]MDV6236619.1 hypothetical protein [Leptospira ellisii]PJZ93860.1 hypothetical protein CH379_05610 [Leptospira ellisii]PKA05518.1 hypothetical protein CH375_04730 [Leptospira ellisii]
MAIDEIDNVADLIDNYAKSIAGLELAVAALNIRLNASPLINFRDALFHFRKLCQSIVNSKEYYQNLGAVDEHLARGAKDILVHLAFILRLRIRYLTQNDTAILLRAKKDRFKLNKVANRLGNLDLKLRHNFGSYNPEIIAKSVDVLTSSINETETILGSLGLNSSLRERFEKNFQK